MNRFFSLFIVLYILKYITNEKTFEINFYKNSSYINESDYSELIQNRLYSTFKIGSSQKKIDLQLYFKISYFSIPFNKVEGSSTYKALDSNFTIFSRTEFNLAQRAE